jgi:hypothetical protein
MRLGADPYRGSLDAGLNMNTASSTLTLSYDKVLPLLLPIPSKGIKEHW